MKGTTRNTDPFAYGTGHMYDGMRYEDAIKNVFSGQNMRGRIIYGTENNEIIDKLAEYITEYGLVRVSHLCKISDMRPEHIKFLMTYRYPVYETDNGRWLGMLQDNGEPYLVKTEPAILPAFTFSKKLENRLVANDNGKEVYFTSHQQAARYFGVAAPTVQRVTNGKKSKSERMKGVTIKWLKRNR